MAGGTWTSQNKKQPGVYINVKSSMAQAVSVGDRGVVAICEPLSWGPEGELMTINVGDDFTPFIGYDSTNNKALFLREIFKGSGHTRDRRRSCYTGQALQARQKRPQPLSRL
uniref:hypothetical protein n=1 Tax=Clostridium sp. NkU-1 TaxID=1095009 RepID=UPI00326090CB